MKKSKKELSDFLKFAYEKGSVKDLHEAFKDFPVEEEYHKGKEELLFQEEKEIQKDLD